MLFAKKQFVRFKYARELFSFSWIGMWLAFLSTVGSPWKSFLYRIDNLKPISSPSFQGEKFIHLAKKLIHLHTTSQFTAKYAFSSWNWHHIQFTNHPTHMWVNLHRFLQAPINMRLMQNWNRFESEGLDLALIDVSKWWSLIFLIEINCKRALSWETMEHKSDFDFNACEKIRQTKNRFMSKS